MYTAAAGAAQRGGGAEPLAGRRLDPAVVCQRTAGNPFFVSQILGQLDSSLPGSVRDAVLARTVGLVPAARRSLELLSCAPEPASGELLAAIGITPPTVELRSATGPARAPRARGGLLA